MRTHSAGVRHGRRTARTAEPCAHRQPARLPNPLRGRRGRAATHARPRCDAPQRTGVRSRRGAAPRERCSAGVRARTELARRGGSPGRLRCPREPPLPHSPSSHLRSRANFVRLHSAAGIRPLQLQSLKILCKGSVWTLPFQHILAGQGSGSRARRMERPRREKKAKVDASALSALSNAKRGVVSRQQQVQVWRPAPANTPQRPRRALRGPPITCIPPRSGSRARTRPPGSGALCDRASTRGPAPARALACSRGVCARRRARSRRGACPSVRLGGVSPSCGGAPALRGCVPVGAVAARLHHRFAAARSVPRGRRHGRPRCSRARAAGARFRGPSPAARRRACYSAAAVPV